MAIPQPIRVLVVDDSPLVRRTLEALLGAEAGVQVVGTAADGIDALAKIRALRPDVVTLDVMMPRLDGLKVLACAMRESPVRVLMLSSLTQEGAEVTLQALDLGAVDFVDKTALLSRADVLGIGAELLAKVRTAAAVNPARLGREEVPVAAAAPPPPPAVPVAGKADLVIIGASTGGPPALHRVIPALPGDFPAAVVVVQHIPAGFTRPLAQRLDAAGALSVREAEQGDRLRPGEVLVAPGGQHLRIVLSGGEPAVLIVPAPADAIYRPSVDAAMQSAAEVYGARVAGVLLTGMGTDGAFGMWAIRSRGGYTIAESEESCVVYGMPRAAIEMGAAAEVLPLARIAERLTASVRAGR
ncbi:MAG TPA: chemotaxis response regulator protein-glutamate methylesterase [bacterium]